jgi:hypothetical protein
MTDQPPVMQLNIAETVNVLEGLDLYVLAPGNSSAIRVEDHESCFKFHVTCTNTSNGERTKEKFALHGRLQSRKGVGIDHKFVVDQFEKTLKQYLADKSMIVSDDLPMGSTVVHAIYRHTFAAGSRVGSYANGVGVFSQPIETNFTISEDPIEKLEAMDGQYTLAVIGDDLIKFYLGEEPPVWGYKHEEKDVWRPIKKRPTPSIISACLDHFTQFVCEKNKQIEVYANDRHAELVQLVLDRQAARNAPVDLDHPVGETPQVLAEVEAPSEKPGLLKRVASAIGMGAIQG